jgi:hypothetical protein
MYENGRYQKKIVPEIKKFEVPKNFKTL